MEKVVRETGTDLTDGAVQVASLHYVDPQRFGDAFAESMAGSYDVKIVPENVSVSPRADADDQAPAYRRGNHSLHQGPRHRRGLCRFRLYRRRRHRHGRGDRASCSTRRR